jgi:DNA-binding transcriptional regulator LsrR (DeoR family)
VSQSRKQLHAAIVDTYLSGIRQKAIVERTGMTRESIRRILRAGGVEADE